MNVIEISQEQKDLWNSFLDSHSFGDVFQSYEWGEVQKVRKLFPLRLAVMDEGKVVGGVSLLKIPLSPSPATIFYAPRGFACDYRRAEILQALLPALREYGKRERAIFLKVDPDIPRGGEEAGVLKSLGFVHASSHDLFGTQPSVEARICLEKDQEELFARLGEGARASLKRGEKSGTSVREGNREEWRYLYAFLEETARRNRFFLDVPQFYQTLVETFPGSLGRLFIAEQDGTPTGALWIFLMGRKCCFGYGASSLQSLKSFPNHLLHWHVMTWAKSKGYRWYNLRGIPQNPRPGDPLYGLYFFKKSLGAEEVRLAGEFDLVFSSFQYGLVERSLSLVKRFPSLFNFYRKVRSACSHGR